MAAIVDVTDLPTALHSREGVSVWLDGANAMATRVAPCLAAGASLDALAEARLVLVGAIERWSQAGSGALQSQQAGPFAQTVDTRQRTGYALWPSEVAALQAICATSAPRAGELDLIPAASFGTYLPVIP